MFEKLKQFKDLRSQAKKIQQALSEENVIGEAAWGKIRVTMNGNQEVLSVTIAPEMIGEGGKEKLESSLAEAMNDAIKKIQKVMAKKIQSMEGFDLSAFGKK